MCNSRLRFVIQGLRSFLAVILGPCPAALGFPPAVIGAVFTASRMGGALSTMAFTAVAGRDGRWGAVPAAPRHPAPCRARSILATRSAGCRCS